MRDRFKNREDVRVQLVKSSGGAFEISVNDKLMFSKKKLGRFPSDAEIDVILAA